jgi:hypothetical protein
MSFQQTEMIEPNGTVEIKHRILRVNNSGRPVDTDF